MASKSEISEGVGVNFKVLGFSEKMECDVYECSGPLLVESGWATSCGTGPKYSE